jgi:anti-sigma factor RsiW
VKAQSKPAECRAVLERVSAYLDGELPPPDCRAIERHCAKCDACTRSLEGLCDAIALCRKTSITPLPRSFTRRAHERIEELLGPVPRKPASTRRGTR